MLLGFYNPFSACRVSRRGKSISNYLIYANVLNYLYCLGAVKDRKLPQMFPAPFYFLSLFKLILPLDFLSQHPSSTAANPSFITRVWKWASGVTIVQGTAEATPGTLCTMWKHFKPVDVVKSEMYRNLQRMMNFWNCPFQRVVKAKSMGTFDEEIDT